MTSRFLTPAGLRNKKTARLTRRAGNVFRTSVVWLAMAACAAGQQASAPPAPTTAASTQIPDAPSTTKQQPGSFGHGVATVIKTIGQDELHLITAPFRIDSVGFTDEPPFLNKTLFWDSVVVGATGVLIAKMTNRSSSRSPSVGTRRASTSRTRAPTEKWRLRAAST